MQLVDMEVTVSESAVVYPAYPPAACTTISVLGVTGGTGDYSYFWSTGEITESIEVCPIVETEYSVIVLVLKNVSLIIVS